MDTKPAKAILPGGRLHLHHGPIDLIIKAGGDSRKVEKAYEKAEQRFQTVLSELVSELTLLRQVVSPDREPETPVAGRMWRASCLFSDKFITPMAAVAGSVADEILQVMIRDTVGLTKVFVNNGGDIALWKNSKETFAIEVASHPGFQSLPGSRPITLNIDQSVEVGGVATSGRYGRSLSLGVADSVTVLAKNAAIADASATLIANAVDIGSDKVRRLPASELELDSDLGEQLVTVEVGELNKKECQNALKKGMEQAQEYLDLGLVKSAFIFLQGQYVSLPDDLTSMIDSSLDKSELLYAPN